MATKIVQAKPPAHLSWTRSKLLERYLAALRVLKFVRGETAAQKAQIIVRIANKALSERMMLLNAIRWFVSGIDKGGVSNLKAYDKFKALIKKLED